VGLRTTQALLVSFCVLTTLTLGCRGTGSGRYGRSERFRSISGISDRPERLARGGENRSSTISSRVDPPSRDDRDEPTGVVVGRVVDDRGAPLADARVRLAIDGRPGGRAVEGYTNRDGRFRLEGLRPGRRYDLIAEWQSDRERLVGRVVAEPPEQVRIRVAPEGRPPERHTFTGNADSPSMEPEIGSDPFGWEDSMPDPPLNLEDLPAAGAPSVDDRESPRRPSNDRLQDAPRRVEPEAESGGHGWVPRDSVRPASHSTNEEASPDLNPQRLSEEARTDRGRGLRDQATRLAIQQDADPLAAFPEANPLPPAIEPPWRDPHAGSETMTSNVPSRRPLERIEPLGNEPTRRARPIASNSKPPHSWKRSEGVEPLEPPRRREAEQIASNTARPPRRDSNVPTEPMDPFNPPRSSEPIAQHIEPRLPAGELTLAEPSEAFRDEPPLAFDGPESESGESSEPSTNAPPSHARTAQAAPALEPEPRTVEPATEPPSAEHLEALLADLERLDPKAEPPERPRSAIAGGDRAVARPERLGVGASRAARPSAEDTNHQPRALTWADVPTPKPLQPKEAEADRASGRQPLRSIARFARVDRLFQGAEWLGANRGPETKPEEVRPFCRYDPIANRLDDFELPDLDGRPFRLRDVKSEYVLICFWGTWCDPCLSLLPHLAELQERFHPARFQVIGVAYRRDGKGGPRSVASTARRLGVNFPILMGPKKEECPVREHLGVRFYPTMVLFDRAGRVVWRDVGATPENIRNLDQTLAGLLSGGGRTSSVLQAHAGRPLLGGGRPGVHFFGRRPDPQDEAARQALQRSRLEDARR